MIQRSHQGLISEPDHHGFTIVELLVVIVVIGILAAITIVAYAGISQRAIVSSLQSDLINNATKLKAYQTLYGSYPTAMDGNNCPTAPTVDASYCLKASSGNAVTYSSIVPATFHLTDTNGSNSYSVTDTTSPTIATTANGSAVGSACPSSFIPVPGSGTYSTSDFCVMKYAASHSDATAGTQGTSAIPISAPSVQQWVNVSQITAIADAPNVAGCPTCHLITEPEYLTIAQNVLSVASNWSGGTVGNGAIYSGHNDNAPANALVADPSDSNGYSGETNQGGSQRRTLTLTNGQVIWDLAGNVDEWTSGQTSGGQPGIISGGYAWRQWTVLTTHGTLSPDPFPGTTGISGASSWTVGDGIGQIYSSADSSSLVGFLRGGYWAAGGTDGVLSLELDTTPTSTAGGTGFRVSR